MNKTNSDTEKTNFSHKNYSKKIPIGLGCASI